MKVYPRIQDKLPEDTREAVQENGKGFLLDEGNCLRLQRNLLEDTREQGRLPVDTREANK
jgi:hypothetical protein